MAQRTQFDPLGAGALLLSVCSAVLGVGALIGHRSRVGRVRHRGRRFVGVPASIAAVIVRYRNA